MFGSWTIHPDLQSFVSMYTHVLPNFSSEPKVCGAEVATKLNTSAGELILVDTDDPRLIGLKRVSFWVGSFVAKLKKASARVKHITPQELALHIGR